MKVLNVPKLCPAWLKAQIIHLKVQHWDMHGNLCHGIIQIHESITEPIEKWFIIAQKLKFPIESLIPCSNPLFLKGNIPSDHLSMRLNNSSGFNFRLKEGKTEYSIHSLGLAIDINPKQNPFISGATTLPSGSAYNPEAPGTFNESHPLVHAFLELGFTWGGNWRSHKDYHHFELDPKHPVRCYLEKELDKFS
jgi:hypothetical protein